MDLNGSTVVSILAAEIPHFISILADLAVAGVSFWAAQRTKSNGFMLIGFSAVAALLFTLPFVAWQAYLIGSRPDFSRISWLITVISVAGVVGRLLTATLTVLGVIFLAQELVRKSAMLSAPPA